MITLKDIVDFCRVESVASKLNPTEEARWRKFCRDYSKKFFTPLHEVYNMDPEFVILQVLEEQLDDVDPVEHLETLMNVVYGVEDPNFEATQEKDLQEFIKDAEEEEESRVAEGRAIYQPKKKKSEEKPKKELPKQGYLNLSYLEKQDQEE